MPRTSSNSVRHDAVPLDEVLRAARAWSAGLKQQHPHIVRIGYFGSYARGDYVPGSDLDVLLEVAKARAGRQADRASEFLPERFPVGMELFVYSSGELARLRSERSSFIAAIDREFVSV